MQKYLQYEYKLNLNPKAFFINNGGVTFEQCLELRNKKWPEVVPLGNLHDIHHGACFRFFNMDQEIIAHNWTAADEKNEFAQSWTAIQLEAKVVTDEFKEVPKGGGGPMGSMAMPAPSPKKKSYKQIKSEGLIIDGY